MAPPPPPGPPQARSDQDFINQAMGMGSAEIGMGRLAKGKAASKAVKALAGRMVADHTRANQRLAALAKSLKIDVTPTPDQPPPDLVAATGPDFDKAYISMLISGHQNMIALFESEAGRLLEARLPLPGYEMILKAAHTFNLLDARGAISVTERADYIRRIRDLSRRVAQAYYDSREALGFPMLRASATETSL